MKAIDLIGIVVALLIALLATWLLGGTLRIVVLLAALAVFVASVAHGARGSQRGEGD